jgi:dihydrolipoamide dehydrogenase
VAIHVGTTVTQSVASASGLTATLANGSTVTAERCLIAIGMIANSQGLGLEALGIETERGVAVNEFLRTRQPHIAAIGDCLRGHGLAHLAGTEGVLAVENVCGTSASPLNHQLVPRCIYTDPEIAQVGVTESGAPDSARVSRLAFAALGKALCDDEPEGFVKLIVDEATGRILGGTIVGAHASDLIHLVVLAMSQGLTAKQLARTITAHPTWPEAVSEAASQLYGESLASAHAARAPRKGGVVG